MATGYLLTNDAGVADGYAKILASVASINLKNTGQTTLYTVPTGRSLILLDVIPVVTSANTVAVGPTITVGKSSALTDWIVATVLLAANFDGTSKTLSLAGSATGLAHKVYAAGDIIQVDVTAGATATTLTATFHVLGILF